MELSLTIALIVTVASIVIVTIVAMLISFAVLAFEDLIYSIKNKFTQASWDELSEEEEARIQAAADELGIRSVTYCNGVRIVE